MTMRFPTVVVVVGQGDHQMFFLQHNSATLGHATKERECHYLPTYRTRATFLELLPFVMHLLCRQ